jgi:glycosyltransferase involved in cell wall biosynthesis
MFRRPAVQRTTGRIDVIHATTLAIPPRSAPLVVTVHDLAFLCYPEHFTRRGLRLFNRGLELALTDADRVICPSYATRRACLEAGFEDGRLQVVPLGVEIAPASDAEIGRVKRIYHLERDYVLWTGTIEPRKNLRRLLEAWMTIDADLDLILAGPMGWREDLDALIGPEGSVRRLGYVERPHLAALYAGARLLCWPSLLEGFGFPVLEAMAQGTPVVTSRGTSTEELAGNAAMLVDPLDVGSIAKGIESVLSDERLAAGLSHAGRDRVLRFSWAHTADLLVNAYVEVAS